MPEAVRHRAARGRPVLYGLALLLFAALAYALSLVVTAPARVVERFIALPPAIDALSGTVWDGGALLRSGHLLSWRFDAAASLRAVEPRFAMVLEGDDTRLTGWLVPMPEALVLLDVRGRAGWPLVRAAMPDLVLTCDPVARVEIGRAILRPGFGGAVGRVQSGAGLCEAPGHSVPVPPLVLRLDVEGEARSNAVLAGADDTELARAVVAGGESIVLTIAPAGARLVPGMPSSGETVLEFPL